MRYKNIIRFCKVKELTKLSRTTIYRLIAKGEFPKQVKLSERSFGWVEQEVMDYLNNKIENRG